MFKGESGSLLVTKRQGCIRSGLDPQADPDGDWPWGRAVRHQSSPDRRAADPRRATLRLAKDYRPTGSMAQMAGATRLRDKTPTRALTTGA